MKQAFIKLHIAIILAGFTGIFGKLITLNEGLLVWYRISLAALVLLLILAVNQKLEKVTWVEFGRIAFCGILLGLHWVGFYASIKYSNISVGVVCFSLTGFFTALFSPLLNRHRVVASELLLSMLTLAGIALIFGFDSKYRLGVVLGVISSMVAALYTLTNERLARSFKSETITAYSLLGGAIGITLLLPIYLRAFPVSTILPSASDWFFLSILALFCTVLLYLLQTQVIKQISAFTVNLSLNLEPVYTIILAILIYHENKELNWAFYAGVSLIILSVVLQMIKLTRQNVTAGRSAQ